MSMTFGAGECPQCKSSNLNYGALDLTEGDQVSYRFVCGDCGCKGEEWYTLEYSESTITQKGTKKKGKK